MNTYSVLTSSGEKIGRYTGNSPSQAGLKALRQIFKQTGKNPKHISIIKNGRDSDNKVRSTINSTGVFRSKILAHPQKMLFLESARFLISRKNIFFSNGAL
jgi:hypothetical protein